MKDDEFYKTIMELQERVYNITSKLNQPSSKGPPPYDRRPRHPLED